MKIVIATIVSMLSVALSAHAGEFVISRVWKETAPSPLSSTMIWAAAGASAIYEGPVDLDDRYWGLEANLIIDGETHYSSTGGKQGNTVSLGMEIECSPWNCGASRDFENCPRKSWGHYGVVVIDHQSGPEDTDRQDGYMVLTQCESQTGNDGPCDISDNGGPWQDGGSTDPQDPAGCCYTLCSPILINLDGESFHLSGPESPVHFDIDHVNRRQRPAIVTVRLAAPAEAVSVTVATLREAIVEPDRRDVIFVSTPQ